MSQYKAGMTVLYNYHGDLVEVILIGQYKEMYPHKIQEDPFHPHANRWAIIANEQGSIPSKPDYWYQEEYIVKVVCKNYVRGQKYLQDIHLLIKSRMGNARVFPYKVGDEAMIIS